MGTLWSVLIGIVIFFAICGFLFTPKGEDPEEGAKVGGMIGISLIISLLPTIMLILFIIFIVKSCS